MQITMASSPSCLVLTGLRNTSISSCNQHTISSSTEHHLTSRQQNVNYRKSVWALNIATVPVTNWSWTSQPPASLLCALWQSSRTLSGVKSSCSECATTLSHLVSVGCSSAQQSWIFQIIVAKRHLHLFFLISYFLTIWHTKWKSSTLRVLIITWNKQ